MTGCSGCEGEGGMTWHDACCVACDVWRVAADIRLSRRLLQYEQLLL